MEINKAKRVVASIARHTRLIRILIGRGSIIIKRWQHGKADQQIILAHHSGKEVGIRDSSHQSGGSVIDAATGLTVVDTAVG